MDNNRKDFIKWFLIYGIAFGVLTALFDYFQGKSMLIMKNIIGGLIFGLAMSYLKIRAERRRKNENKK
jgi:hypothetical protein